MCRIMTYIWNCKTSKIYMIKYYEVNYKCQMEKFNKKYIFLFYFWLIKYEIWQSLISIYYNGILWAIQYFFLNQNLFFRFLEVHIKPTPTYNVASMPLPI